MPVCLHERQAVWDLAREAGRGWGGSQARSLHGALSGETVDDGRVPRIRRGRLCPWGV